MGRRKNRPQERLAVDPDRSGSVGGQDEGFELLPEAFGSGQCELGVDVDLVDEWRNSIDERLADGATRTEPLIDVKGFDVRA